MSEATVIPPPAYTASPEPIMPIIPVVTRLEGDNSQEWNISLNITMDDIQDIHDEQNDDNPITSVLLSIVPSKGIERTKVHLCCVVDVSGSMGAEAFMKSQDGIRESDGLSILDLVKHALKTVISTMTEHDTLSIVSFATEAQVILRPVNMNEINRETALRLVEGLEPLDTTNMWGGLETGWNLLLEESGDNLKSMFLFTDGMPNVVPPRGHMPQLHKYIEHHNDGKPVCPVSTFGFGNCLDSYLLDNIARTTCGTYTFIPDVSFVGTAFINATANLYSCMARDLTLHVKPLFDVSIHDVPGGVLHEKHQDGSVTIHLGNLNFDQSRDVIVNITGRIPEEHDLLLAEVDMTATMSNGEKDRLIAQLHNNEFELLSEDDVETAEVDHIANLYTTHLRLAIVHAISHDDVTKDKPEAQFQPDVTILDRVKQLVVELETNPEIENALGDVFAMGKDVSGQITEAIEERYYEKWGKHYLLSLANGYRTQTCNNFKDPGVQMYGGELFKALQDNFDDIFNKLPAPKPSRRGTRGGFMPVSLAHYNSSSNPCFHGNSPVHMADGKKKLVRDVRKGDEVITLDGTVAKVVCVVKTTITAGSLDMVKLPGDLWITPWHPVYNLVLEEWMYPHTLRQVETVKCDAVYSYLLDSKHSVMIGYYACVTLAHGARGDIREHPYFGTDAVVNDMKMTDGYEDGLVICKGTWTSLETHMVCGLDFIKAKDRVLCM